MVPVTSGRILMTTSGTKTIKGLYLWKIMLDNSQNGFNAEEDTDAQNPCRYFLISHEL